MNARESSPLVANVSAFLFSTCCVFFIQGFQRQKDGYYAHSHFVQGNRELCRLVGRQKGVEDAQADGVSSDEGGSNSKRQRSKVEERPPVANTQEEGKALTSLTDSPKSKKSKINTAEKLKPEDAMSDMSDDEDHNAPGRLSGTTPTKKTMVPDDAVPTSHTILSWQQDPKRSGSDWKLFAIDASTGQALKTYHVHSSIFGAGNPRTSTHLSNIVAQRQAGLMALQEPTGTEITLASSQHVPLLDFVMDYMYDLIPNMDDRVRSLLTKDTAVPLLKLVHNLQIASLMEPCEQFCLAFLKEFSPKDLVSILSMTRPGSIVFAATLQHLAQGMPSNLDASLAAQLEPTVLLLLCQAMPQQSSSSEPGTSSRLLSRLVAASLSTPGSFCPPEVYLHLTSSQLLLPGNVDGTAALQILVTESLNPSLSAVMEGSEWHERCVNAMTQDWATIRSSSDSTSDQEQLLAKLPATVLAKLLLKLTAA